jgi:kinetochore protein Nuf2
MSDPLTFPSLKPKEILSFLSLLNLPEHVALDDLKHPSSPKSIAIMRTFVKYLMGVSEQELGSQAFFAAEVLADHHMLHEQSVPTLNLWSNLNRLMRVVGVSDFTVRDLLVPQSNRFMAQLSALINFTRFRGEQEQTALRLEKETVRYLSCECSDKVMM